MGRRIMGFLDKGVLLVVALCLTGTNAQCGEQEYNAFLGCLCPHLLSLIPLAMGSVCNKELFTEDLCQKFATIVRCVNGITVSSTCRRDTVTLINEQIKFACQLNDLQDVCTGAPALDTEETIHTTTSSSKAIRGQMMESTSIGIGRGSVPQASMILLMIYIIMLTLVL